ncbi:MAG: serine hydrolase [Acidobacteria bacterium]|nr:serine hydrolase [Acidobacteriota bacterium]
MRSKLDRSRWRLSEPRVSGQVGATTWLRQRSRFLAGLFAAALTGVFAFSVRAQDGYDYYSFTAEITWRGSQALEICNSLFVGGRTVDQIYGQELAGLVPGASDAMPRSRVEIDERLKIVAVGVGGNDAVPPMRAAYREGFGCVVMAPHQTAGDIDKLPLLQMAPPPGDPAATPWPDGDRAEQRPLPPDVDRAALDAAGNWAFDRASHGGHAGQVTLSLLVVHRGHIVYERYAPGVDRHTRTRTWSAAKSITSTLVGIAVGKGLLKLDEPLPFDWPPKTQGAPDPRKRITLRHVLHMSSGLYPVDNDHQEALGSYLSYFGGWNSADHARDRGLIREPGTVWDYENYDTLLVVLALKTALGDQKTYLECPRRVLFDRIGMRNTLASVDRFGNYVLSSQVYTNARDLARLGLLYLNRGKWNGEQVLPEQWVDFVRTPAPSTRRSGNQYGGHWWLVPDARTDLPQDAYTASGARGQFAIVVPSYDLVVVRRGLDSRRGGEGLSNWDLLREVLKAFPSRRGGAKLVATAPE